MSYREELCEFLRASELYKHAADDIEKLIAYISVPIEKGSLAYLFSFKRLHVRYEDELPWLAGNPSTLAPNPSMEEAVTRLHEMIEEYEYSLINLSKIVDYGVEKYIQENMDMVDQYYVCIDTRDKLVEPFVERKISSLEELNKLACTDCGFYLIQSAWREAYGNLFNLYFLREQVGFDRAQFNVDIVSFDKEKLLQAKRDLQGNSYDTLPRIIVEYVDPDDKKDYPMILPLADSENKFKKIEITLSHHVTFLFQRNNSNLKNEEERISDIYLLKTTVEPAAGYEILGNIGNYSYDEMGLVIQQAVMELYELTGIELDPDSIRLNDVEINLTFRQNCDFNDLMRSVSYYQNYCRKGYVTKEFKASDEGIVHFCADRRDCITEDLWKKKKRRIIHKYSKMKTTGFTTSSQSVSVKLYDKKEETIVYANSQGYDLKIEGDEAIIRLEFRIRNRDQLKRYFDTGKEPVYFWNLSQQKIEKAYIGLVDKFFKQAYEQGYVPESLNVLIGIVSALNTSERGGKWKQKLIKDILSQEIWQKSTPALLREVDIASVIQYNPTFARHPDRYKKILFEILRESEIYKKGQINAYDMLLNFLNKTYHLKTIGQRRRVGYAVSEAGGKLPNKESEIQQILEMRAWWDIEKNSTIDEYAELTKKDPRLYLVKTPLKRDK